MRSPTTARRVRAVVAAAAVVGMVASGLLLLADPAIGPGAPPAALQATTAPAEFGRPAVEGDLARERAVTDVLLAWGDAVQTQDTAALTALMDPAADEEFVRAELSRAANLVGVPLADWGYEIGDSAALVPPADLRAATGADELYAPPVVLRYALDGVDPTPTRKPVGLVLARRGDAWRLVSDTAVADRGRETWRGPWDFGPVRTRSSAAGLVLGHPGQEQTMDTLLAELDDGVAAVTDFWGAEWPQRAAVLLPASQPELSAQVGAGFDGEGVAAVTTADAVDRRAGTATGVRVVLNPTTLGRLGETSLRIVLRHELTHVAARTVTADAAPLWMLEGFADYSGYRGSGIALADGAPTVSALVEANGPPDTLPADDDFRSAAGSAVAYQLSWTFAEYVAATFGEDVLLSAYRAVAALPGPSPAEMDAALLASTGRDLGALRQGWGEWLPGALGLGR